MSTTSTVAKLKEDLKKIEERLTELEAQKKEVDEKYFAVLEEEKRTHEELRKCRDTYQYSQLEVRANMLARRRREVEPKKQEIDRKIRGHLQELEKVKARIGYMKPKGELVSHKVE